MTPNPVSRWAVSFADLAMLLLGFFVMLYAGKADVRQVASSARAALDSEETAPAGRVFEWPGKALFASGEARLTGSARARLVVIGREAARRGENVRVESLGTDPAAHRFDGWELAAARAAAAARALREGGLEEEAVEIAMPPRQNRNAPHQLIVRVGG